MDSFVQPFSLFRQRDYGYCQRRKRGKRDWLGRIYRRRSLWEQPNTEVRS